MNISVVSSTIGILLMVVGGAMLFPALLDLQDGHENYQAFLYCAVVSLFFGGAFIVSNWSFDLTLNTRETFMLTTLSWFSVSLFSCFPLYFSDIGLSFTDAFFEAISGITTTGSTVLSGLDQMSRGVLLWRSIMQWIGGIGIVAFAIVIMPFLQVGGMGLFKTESSDKSDKAMSKTTDIIASLLSVYVGLTALCAIVYYILGMGVFDALNHALTTIPTGGYSTHDASFGHYDSAALQYAGSFFMLAGGLPFILYIKFVFKGKNEFWQDEQFKYILMLIGGLSAFLAFWLAFNSDYGLADSLRLSVFNIISVLTTTGYATTDYTLWGYFAVAFFFFITFLGTCTGSTSGGIKMMRLIILYRIVVRQLKALVFPSGVFPVRYQGKAITDAMAISVLAFMGVFVLSNAVLTIALTFIGLDFETAISGAATALANVGPGVGDIIGPAGNFSTLPDLAKWVLCLGMLLGRLEVMTVLVLFSRNYWKY